MTNIVPTCVIRCQEKRQNQSLVLCLWVEKNIHILVILTKNCSVTVRDLPFFLLNSGIFLKFVSKCTHTFTQSRLWNLLKPWANETNILCKYQLLSLFFLPYSIFFFSFNVFKQMQGHLEHLCVFFLSFDCIPKNVWKLIKCL